MGHLVEITPDQRPGIDVAIPKGGKHGGFLLSKSAREIALPFLEPTL